MLVTRLEELNKGKVKVYIEGEYHFLLYKKDINTYKLCENENISEEVYQDIKINTVFRRAKQKALAILKYMDRTEQELYWKLRQAEYTDEIIYATIDYVKAYHYIDDERYVRNYIEYKKSSKSKRQIEMELAQKGISKDYMEHAFADQYSGEEEAIKKAISKKTKNVENLSYEEKLKLVNFLYRKGFKMDLINKSINYVENYMDN